MQKKNSLSILSMLIGMLMCLHHSVSAQENADTLKPAKDTIITINDTLIKVSEDSIIQQERGESQEVTIIMEETETKKWKKLENAFKRDSTKHLSVIGFPIIAYLPETDWTFGGVLQFFFRQKKTVDNHLSVIRLKGQYTLNKQSEAFAEYELFLGKKNRTWLDGIIHYQNWLEEFYGIGNETPYENREIIEYQRWYSDFRFLYKAGRVHIGAQTRFSKVFDMNTTSDSSVFSETEITGNTGYQTIGIGPAFVIDTRDNNLFPFKGYYISLSNFNHPEWTSKSQFSFYNLQFDYRHFFNPRKGKHVFAMQAYLSANFGEPPFRLLALHGGQYLGRGYYEGRYRDRLMWLAQLEWRFPIAWHFRGVLFGSAADVAHVPSDWSLQTIKWSVGIGLRYVINQKVRNTIRLDYAHGKSKNDKGFYFGTGEVF